MSKKKFILVMGLYLLAIVGVYLLCSMLLFPHAPSLAKLVLGIVMLIAMIINIIKIYREKVKPTRAEFTQTTNKKK
jgi:uncharacterized membrane protein YphA (DoxX/SURF4 family)